jgi:hypothetical protein
MNGSFISLQISSSYVFLTFLKDFLQYQTPLVIYPRKLE